MDTNKLMDYKELKVSIKAQERKIKKDKSKAAELEEELLPMFKDEGIDSMRIGGNNVRLDRKLWASAGGDMPGLVNAMKAAELDDLVGETVNGSTLSAWVREFDPEGLLSPDEVIQQLPVELHDSITVNEVFKLLVTK